MGADDVPSAGRLPQWLVRGLDPDCLHATQNERDFMSLYLARKVSRYVTPLLLRMGLSANQATAVWGSLSLANSVLIYMAVAGSFALVLVIPVLYFLVEVIDCADGEIARYRQTASPIGGKLLDGIWHKATEYSLLIAYTAGLRAWRMSDLLLPTAMLLVSGEAMYTYAYERRLTVLRIFAKSSERVTPVSEHGVYTRDERWRDFRWPKKVEAIKALVQYKSIYFMIALSAVSSDALLLGLIILAIYKHYSWIQLIVRTVRQPPQTAD